MNQKISERVSVNLVYDHIVGSVTPQHLTWQHRLYTITKVGLHYTLYQGRTLIHMFAVADKNHYFLLSFNTQTLVWKLEEMEEQFSN